MTTVTLKGRILLWVGVVNALVFIAAGAVLLLNAKFAVRTEVLAARDSAVALIQSSLAAGAQTGLAGLAQPRHVRILLPDGPAPDAAPATTDTDAAPDWFLRWVAPEITPVEIIPPQGAAGRILVLAEPHDEAAEVWEDMTALCVVWGLAALVQMALLALIVGQALRPLQRLNSVLGALEAGDLSARAGGVGTAELAPMARRIDALAETLAMEQQSRRQIARRLLDARDSERRQIARDLHDELGPRLFGLTVAADAIARADLPEQKPHLDTILSHVDSIRSINRRVMAAVRPVTLDRMALPDVVRDLVGDLEDLHRNVQIELSVAPDLPQGGESIALTIYRAIQEGVTNALRHGGAGHVQICLQRTLHDQKEAIRLVLRDDGRGLAQGWRKGSGLMGMGERAEAIGGQFGVTDRPGGGVELGLLLPVAA